MPIQWHTGLMVTAHPDSPVVEVSKNESDLEFVYFGNDWFAENRTSSHHIARRLGSRFPLLYVESPGLRAPKATGRDLRKLFTKLRRAFRPPQVVAPHFWVMTLPQIPLRRLAMVRTINRICSRFMVRRAMRKLGFHHPIAWFHVPHPGFLAGELGETLAIFYCIDDYSKLPDVDGVAVQQMDHDLTVASDLVFACNQGLADARVALNKNIHVSPHGVDTEAFARAGEAGTAQPDEVRKLAHPIIGMWGLFDARVDQSLIEHIAKARPNWTILILGRVAVETSVLNHLPNVIFGGVIPYNKLANWAAAIDVCILPYVQNELNAVSSPLKLREYLATGKPIVAVPLPEVLSLGAVIQIAEDGAGFVRAIESAMTHNSPELAEERRKAVAGNTWDATVARIMGVLQAELKSRAGTNSNNG
jgi:glycosyltransferase involved in cell wall biosynthesis